PRARGSRPGRIVVASRQEPDILSAHQSNVVSHPTSAGASGLLDDFSLEMTGKDIDKLHEARDSIPPGTRINITFLGNEDAEMSLRAGGTELEQEYIHGPHISG